MVVTFISKKWDRICRSPNLVCSSFPIPENRIIHSPHHVEFKAQKAYFEIRICEQFLRDRREYWNEYIPLTVISVECIYNRERRLIPFILGPRILKGIEELVSNEAVCYRNTRAVGPIPYSGDDVDIFIGLFRVKIRDWSPQALALLESISKIFDPSDLLNYLKIARVLIEGIEFFLGMGVDMEFRLGQRTSFTDPKVHNDSSSFSPGYFVIIHNEECIEKDKLWVKNSRLYTGDNESELEPYIGQDYVLYQIASFDERTDYATCDFHLQWSEVERQIYDGNDKMAIQEYQRVIRLIGRSPDLIDKDRKRFRDKYHEEFLNIKQSFDSTNLDDLLAIAHISSRKPEEAKDLLEGATADSKK